jgi:hypothetical protein
MKFAFKLLASAVLLPFLMPILILGYGPIEIVRALVWDDTP